MQYSRGGGTMSQMSVPVGAWEDLRREVGDMLDAQNPNPNHTGAPVIPRGANFLFSLSLGSHPRPRDDFPRDGERV